MPMPGNKSWVYTPKDVHSLSQMNYTYENLKQVPVVNLLEQRLSRLGVAAPRDLPVRGRQAQAARLLPWPASDDRGAAPGAAEERA